MLAADHQRQEYDEEYCVVCITIADKENGSENPKADDGQREDGSSMVALDQRGYEYRANT